MNKHRAQMIAAMLGGLAAGIPGGRVISDDEDRDAPEPAYKHREVYSTPLSAPWVGNAQGERLKRQMARGQLDFSASEKCLARIRERLEQGGSV